MSKSFAKIFFVNLNKNYPKIKLKENIFKLHLLSSDFKEMSLYYKNTQLNSNKINILGVKTDFIVGSDCKKVGFKTMQCIAKKLHQHERKKS